MLDLTKGYKRGVRVKVKTQSILLRFYEYVVASYHILSYIQFLTLATVIKMPCGFHFVFGGMIGPVWIITKA